MADEQDIKIAVLSEKVDSLKTQGAADVVSLKVQQAADNSRIAEQQKIHAENSTRQFEKIFELIRPVTTWVSKNEGLPEAVASLKTAVEWIDKNKDLPETVKSLKTEFDKQSGFLNASRLFMGAIGGAFCGGIVMLVNWLTGRHL